MRDFLLHVSFTDRDVFSLFLLLLLLLLLFLLVLVPPFPTHICLVTDIFDILYKIAFVYIFGACFTGVLRYIMFKYTALSLVLRKRAAKMDDYLFSIYKYLFGISGISYSVLW